MSGKQLIDRCCKSCKWWCETDPKLCLEYQEGTCLNADSEKLGEFTLDWEWCNSWCYKGDNDGR